MANTGLLSLIVLLIILFKILTVTSPSTKGTTELLSRLDIIGALTQGSSAVLLKLVVYIDEQEKDPRTNNLVSTTTMDICIPSLRWRISREYRNPPGFLATTFANISVGCAVSCNQLRITVRMVLNLITLVLLLKRLRFDSQHDFFGALKTVALSLWTMFSDDTVLIAIRPYIVRA